MNGTPLKSETVTTLEQKSRGTEEVPCFVRSFEQACSPTRPSPTHLPTQQHQSTPLLPRTLGLLTLSLSLSPSQIQHTFGTVWGIQSVKMSYTGKGKVRGKKNQQMEIDFGIRSWWRWLEAVFLLKVFLPKTVVPWLFGKCLTARFLIGWWGKEWCKVYW